MNNFEERFKIFFEKCQEIVSKWDEMRKNVYPATLHINQGSRYIKIVRKDISSKSVWAFVDKINGDVLKPASWSAPAKHARGNIFDEHNGLKNIGYYGPAYLR